jgi:hypothetical protein
MAAMFGARDGVRAAVRFTMAAVITTVVLTVALAPATVVKLEAAEALVQNSVLFPLGLTHDRTPAGSLLPGHVLTGTGTAGHVVSVGLLLAAGLALMFLLGPDVRFGYFIYPIGLLGWLALTQPRLECGRLVQ